MSEEKADTRQAEKMARQPLPVREKKRKRIDHKALEEHTGMKEEEGLEVTCGKREGPDSVQVTISALRTISGKKISKGKKSAMKNLGGRAEQSNI